MGVTYGSYISDSDLTAWYVNILSNGGNVSQSVRKSVLDLILKLKASGIWDKLLEVYIFCGVDDFNSTLSKLKYVSSPRLTNVGFLSTDYVKNGLQCGLQGSIGATGKYILTGIGSNDLSSTNRSAGVYETKRANNYYDTIIGRDKDGAGNSAWGPTVNLDNTINSRLNDVAYNTYTLGGNSSTLAGGLLYIGSGPTEVALFNNKTWASFSIVQGQIVGSTPYRIGGNIGGGSSMAGNISIGFIGTYLNQTDTINLSTYFDAFMTDIGGNV